MMTVHDGLAVYRFGAGRPLLFMPYPHAVNVVGDRIPDALIQGLMTATQPAAGEGHFVPTRAGSIALLYRTWKGQER